MRPMRSITRSLRVLAPWLVLLLPAFPTHSAQAESGGASSCPAPFDPFQACQQSCSCSCPGGIIIPAVPTSAIGPAAPSAAETASGGSFHGHHHGLATTPEEVVNYPIPFVDRPQLLPNGLTQPEFVSTFLNNTSVSDVDVRERLTLGFQNGFADRLQAGASVNIAIDPKISFGSVYGIIQYAANPFMNARMDIGYRNKACDDGSGAFSGGLGLPIKYKFAPGLAVVSGRTTTYGFVDDLVIWDVKGCHTGGMIGVPVGLLATWGESINFGLRTGYRRTIGANAGTSFIPLGFDFAVTLQRMADIGVTFEVPNPLNTPSDPEKIESYAFERRLFIYAQTRL
jgi:hypothetical protein